MFEIADQLNLLKTPPPTHPVVKRIPNGCGCTMIEVHYPSGKTSSCIQYDRRLMLALSHSPYSIAQPDDYFEIFTQNEDLLPLYPKRYVPMEFTSLNEKKKEATDKSKKK